MEFCSSFPDSSRNFDHFSPIFLKKERLDLSSCVTQPLCSHICEESMEGLGGGGGIRTRLLFPRRSCLPLFVGRLSAVGLGVSMEAHLITILPGYAIL